MEAQLPSSADCDRSSIRLLISENSDTNAFVLLPDSVAASISVLNRMAVAKSALHSRQHFSVLPGSSNNASLRPQTLHCAIESCSVPFGPVDMIVSPLAPCRSSHVSRFGAHQVDPLRRGVVSAACMGQPSRIDNRDSSYEWLRRHPMP